MAIDVVSGSPLLSNNRIPKTKCLTKKKKNIFTSQFWKFKDIAPTSTWHC